MLPLLLALQRMNLVIALAWVTMVTFSFTLYVLPKTRGVKKLRNGILFVDILTVFLSYLVQVIFTLICSQINYK